VSGVLSVILPTHDRPDSLPRTIRSIVRQVRRPDELIIVNDGQTAVETQIADEVVSAGIQYHYIRRDVPSLPASRNRGAQSARGDIVVFCEDDVVLPPEYLRRLGQLYADDPDEQVAGIGAPVVEPGDRKLSRRTWNVLSRCLGRGRWSPRRCAARYARLPRALRGRLRPARRLSGGAMSLRRDVARLEQFDEALEGYALGEDREFSFRVGRRHALFVAPELVVEHRPGESGRPQMFSRGRMYAANSLHIARRSVEPGAGRALLVANDLAGTILLYAVWGLLGRNRQNIRFAAGVAVELLTRMRSRMRKLWG